MYDYVKEVFLKCDIMLLQETWLYNFEHTNFTHIIPNSQFHAISSMDETNIQRKGRPFGGCAILWKKNITVSITPVNTTSPRICAVEVNSKQCKVLIVTVYMPNDNDNHELYGDVLSEVSSYVIMNTMLS